jgi:hypothetical protein
MNLIRKIPKLQPLGLAVIVAILTVTICYAIRPELIGLSSAFSSLGVDSPTSYIFTFGFLLSAALLIKDAVHTKNAFQKICRYIAALGFAILGTFQIEHGQFRGDIHRLGGLIMMLAVVISMLGHLISGWNQFTHRKRILYFSLTLFALASATVSILSSSQFKILALQGLAQYVGLISLIGWAVLDNNYEKQLD